MPIVVMHLQYMVKLMYYIAKSIVLLINQSYIQYKLQHFRLKHLYMSHCHSIHNYLVFLPFFLLLQLLIQSLEVWKVYSTHYTPLFSYFQLYSSITLYVDIRVDDSNYVNLKLQVVSIFYRVIIKNLQCRCIQGESPRLL